MALAASSQKVFLQKRTAGSEAKKLAMTSDTGISCSICGDVLQGARELGVHILAAHCDPNQRDELEKDEQQQHKDDEDDDELEDSLVIDGSPGESMEVDVDPLEEDILLPPDGDGEGVEADLPITINLPRKQTPAEARQRFMVYRLPDGGQRYICLVCEKMYTSRYNIRMHMNLHTGNNVHTCKFCGRRFAHKHVYESHVRTHTGERPFACDKCSRKFGDRSNCASHMKRCCPGGITPNNNNSQSASNSPVTKQEIEDEVEEEEEEVEQEESDNSSNNNNTMMAGSISIAPNVSLTPISKLKKPPADEAPRPRLFELAVPAPIGFGANGVTGAVAVVTSSNQQPQPQQQLVLVKFQPQIVAVQSIGAMPVVTANSDEFVNMGYEPGEEDEAEDGIVDDSEEVMIEPDISLDYDDIEETSQEEQTIASTSGMLDKQVQSGEQAESGGGTVFTCSFCAVGYSTQTKLLEHLTNHVDIPHKPTNKELEQGYMTFYTSCRPKFMCLSCGKFFVTIDSVNIHLKVHYQDTMYECGICQQIFAHRHLYEGHLRSAHPGQASCPRCHASFPSHVALAGHVSRCSQQPPATAAASTKIEITPRIFNNNNSTRVVAAAATTETATTKKKPKANRPPPKLILISTDTTQYRRLEGSDHIIIQKQPPPLPVTTPLEISLPQEPLDPLATAPSPSTPPPPMATGSRKPVTIAPKPMESLLSEEAKKILMSSAPRRSPNSSNPRAHKIVETPAGREYIPDTNSNNIINLDTIYPPPNDAESRRGYMLRPCGSGGQQRYVCVDCGKHYTTSYNVRMHRNIHIGKNLYNCKFCNKEFSHKHVWETHERVHTGERPFKCPTCPKDFADRSNYNSHKKICLRLQQQASRPGGSASTCLITGEDVKHLFKDNI